jgi:hypothetical protein
MTCPPGSRPRPVAGAACWAARARRSSRTATFPPHPSRLAGVTPRANALVPGGGTGGEYVLVRGLWHNG